MSAASEATNVPPPGTVRITPSRSRFWKARATVLGLMRSSAAVRRDEGKASPECNSPEAMACLICCSSCR